MESGGKVFVQLSVCWSSCSARGGRQRSLFATSTVSTERNNIFSGCFAKLASGVVCLVEYEVKSESVLLTLLLSFSLC